MTERLAVDTARSSSPDSNLRWTWQHVENALRNLQFGSITLLVQDGVVVQVERVERQRYQRSPHKTN